MDHLTHFFPFMAVPRIYCGGWREGDAWTALPVAVTCPECAKLIRSELTDAARLRDDATRK